jgi:hypothetical protein
MSAPRSTLAVFARLQHELRPDEEAIQKAGVRLVNEVAAALNELRSNTLTGNRAFTYAREGEGHGPPTLELSAGVPPKVVRLIADKNAVFIQESPTSGDWTEIPLGFDTLSGEYVDPSPDPVTGPRPASTLVARALVDALRKKLVVKK